METLVLTIHILIALALIGSVLLQRSEGGGLGIGGGGAGATVIVRMQTDHRAIATRKVAAKPLNLIGIYVWRTHLYCAGQIDDDWFFWRRSPSVCHRGADIQCKIQLGASEALR